MKNKYLKLLNSLDNNSTFNWYDRVLIIDGLNLFFRNFAALNFINEQGVHVGGLGGFLKSLGSLINQIKPTSVYIVFDGIGASTNRKNLNSSYKGGRGTQRITNYKSFNNLDEENEAKFNQISRLIHYLKCLPVKIVAIDKNEADDVIAYLAVYLAEKYNSKNYIVSSDKDFLQLANQNIIIYRPKEKEYYDDVLVKNKFGIISENFIIYKTLVGDQSDKIKGVKDLGPKTLLQKFPLLSIKQLSLDDIFLISEQKYKEHVIYSRIILEKEQLKNNYKIMDLKNPLLSDEEKESLRQITNDSISKLDIPSFLSLYQNDGLGYTIKNVDFWLRDNFNSLDIFN